jgi:hypothetical protein
MSGPASEADDVRWLSQKIVASAFHSVSDEAVMAMARRVLELEELLRIDMMYSERLSIGVLKARAAKAESERAIAQRAAAHWEGVAAANALDVVTEVTAEREACAKAAEVVVNNWWGEERRKLGLQVIEAVRARGTK